MRHFFENLVDIKPNDTKSDCYFKSSAGGIFRALAIR